MSSLYQLFLLRLRSFYREPETIFWTFVFPLLLAVALGVAFRSRPPEPVVVGIEDGPRAEALFQELTKQPDIHAKRIEKAAGLRDLRVGKLDILVSEASPRTYTFDPTRPESRLARLVVDDALQRAEGRVDPTKAQSSLVTEPGSRFIDFLIPGLLGMGLMQAGFWSVGYSVVEMRTRMLIKRLAATPMRRASFLMSFILVRLVFLALELPVVVGFGALAFGVPMRGSLLLFVAVGIVGSLIFAGLGLLVAARARTTQAASGLVNLATTPMMLVSGIFFPVSRFPEAFQPVIRLLPLTALNDALRAVMLEGASWGAIGTPMLVMVVWGVVGFAGALRWFRWE